MGKMAKSCREKDDEHVSKIATLWNIRDREEKSCIRDKEEESWTYGVTIHATDER